MKSRLKAYGAKETKRLLLTMLTEISIIDITHETALVALHSKIDEMEDALQYYTAISHKLDHFISRHKQLQKDSIPVLQVLTSAEFLSKLQ